MIISLQIGGYCEAGGVAAGAGRGQARFIGLFVLIEFYIEYGGWRRPAADK